MKLEQAHQDGEASSFEPVALPQPLFLNGLPRSGSDLLRNILRMFVPVEQHYPRESIRGADLRQEIAAFEGGRNYLSLGHLPFTDISALELAHVRKVLVYADPYDWVLARARFHLSDEIQRTSDHLKSDPMNLDRLLTLMIFGNRQEVPPLVSMYQLNVVAWLGSDVHVVRNEELLAALGSISSRKAQNYFESLLEVCGISPLPADWRKRVQAGFDERRSAAVPGLGVDVPQELPEKHRKLVDYAAPGLRAILGYRN